MVSLLIFIHFITDMLVKVSIGGIGRGLNPLKLLGEWSKFQTISNSKYQTFQVSLRGGSYDKVLITMYLPKECSRYNIYKVTLKR